MNFSHLYSSALDQELSNDDSTRLFLTGKRKAAINLGALQFCDLTECASRRSTVTCSNGIREYNLLSTVNVQAGDFLRIAKQGPEFHHTDSNGTVTYLAGKDFPRRDIAWLNDNEPGWRASTGGTPTCYYEDVDGGRRFLGLNPPPRIANSSETATVLLPYVAKPLTMTADTNVPFTFTDTNGSTTREDLEPYHQALAHYAAAELEKLRVNNEGSQAQMAMFMGYVTRFLAGLRPHGIQTVRLGRNYFAEQRRKGRGNDVQATPYPWVQS